MHDLLATGSTTPASMVSKISMPSRAAVALPTTGRTGMRTTMVCAMTAKYRGLRVRVLLVVAFIRLPGRITTPSLGLVVE